ncbi:hypothetical protein C8R44DRAFT_742969 [Mycena epipterygia]|nr:hypothetical protein C8R44DRAFT_742969 [Mycena epipterygia]
MPGEGGAQTGFAPTLARRDIPRLTDLSLNVHVLTPKAWRTRHMVHGPIRNYANVTEGQNGTNQGGHRRGDMGGRKKRDVERAAPLKWGLNGGCYKESEEPWLKANMQARLDLLTLSHMRPGEVECVYSLEKHQIYCKRGIVGDLCARKLVGKLETFIPKHKVRGYKQKPMQPTNKVQDMRCKIPSGNRRVYYNASQRQGKSQGRVECPKMVGTIPKSVCKVGFRVATPFYMVVHNQKIPDRPELQA